ncbi:hypothetical protein CTI12_AA180310 [Artemisia annua]|uniref:Uncharacterized protein n=1 Tax=Artemisia annua TaxID=35608 RepID=A0A2U1P4L1_ARTAN|nr:hypothetical protein CTI12_AA180310 [Artemisia annua]
MAKHGNTESMAKRASCDESRKPNLCSSKINKVIVSVCLYIIADLVKVSKKHVIVLICGELIRVIWIRSQLHTHEVFDEKSVCLCRYREPTVRCDSIPVYEEVADSEMILDTQGNKRYLVISYLNCVPKNFNAPMLGRLTPFVDLRLFLSIKVRRAKEYMGSKAKGCTTIKPFLQKLAARTLYAFTNEPLAKYSYAASLQSTLRYGILTSLVQGLGLGFTYGLAISCCALRLYVGRFLVTHRKAHDGEIVTSPFAVILSGMYHSVDLGVNRNGQSQPFDRPFTQVIPICIRQHNTTVSSLCKVYDCLHYGIRCDS